MKSLFGLDISVSTEATVGEFPADVLLVVGDGDVCLTPKKARRLAKRLRKAAREADRLNGKETG